MAPLVTVCQDQVRGLWPRLALEHLSTRMRVRARPLATSVAIAMATVTAIATAMAMAAYSAGVRAMRQGCLRALFGVWGARVKHTSVHLTTR